MKELTNFGYSIRGFIGLLLTVAPGMAAWFMGDTVDFYPRWICLGMGLGFGAVVFAIRNRGWAKNSEKKMIREIIQKAGEASKAKKRNKKKGPKINVTPVAETRAPVVVMKRWAPLPMLLLLLGPPCWALAIGLFGNKYLDNTRAVDHHVQFVSYNAPYKSNPGVRVSSWRRPGSEEALRYDFSKFHGVQWNTRPGTPVIVSVKEGFFGWLWVNGVRLSDDDPP